MSSLLSLKKTVYLLATLLTMSVIKHYNNSGTMVELGRSGQSGTKLRREYNISIRNNLESAGWQAETLE